jgi:hypothetical protein
MGNGEDRWPAMKYSVSYNNRAVNIDSLVLSMSLLPFQSALNIHKSSYKPSQFPTNSAAQQAAHIIQITERPAIFKKANELKQIGAISRVKLCKVLPLSKYFSSIHSKRERFTCPYTTTTVGY